MSGRSGWERIKAAELCAAKVRYATEDEAEREGWRIWRTRNQRPNPAMPYRCSLCEGFHLANRVPVPPWYHGSTLVGGVR